MQTIHDLEALLRDTESQLSVYTFNSSYNWFWVGKRAEVISDLPDNAVDFFKYANRISIGHIGYHQISGLFWIHDYYLGKKEAIREVQWYQLEPKYFMNWYLSWLKPFARESSYTQHRQLICAKYD